VSLRWLPLTFGCCCSAAFAQLSGHFYFEKQTFAVGEPVFLYFEVTNTGMKPLEILGVNPYGPLAGYTVKLSSDPSLSSSCAIIPSPIIAAGSSTLLEPGARHVERFLLNWERKSIALGDHAVTASYHTPYGPRDIASSQDRQPVFAVHQELHFLVDSNAKFGSKELQVWVDRVRSMGLPDRSYGSATEELRFWSTQGQEEYGEAVRVLASLAPPSLEETLIGFVRGGYLNGFELLAMSRLNTPRSRAVLADLFHAAPPQSSERYEAARLLAESGDQQWYPSLVDAAKGERDLRYVYDAAESGGNWAIPFLLGLMHSPEPGIRQTATDAMGSTGSRDAVPILLEQLRSPDDATSLAAASSLQALTHRTLKGYVGPPQSQYAIWSGWWSRQGSKVQIYKRTDCAEWIPLK
jgi:hypothetical protein